MKVPIAKIRPNPYQVRKHFDRAAIEALAQEIDTLGFWAPLRARKIDDHYELCFGHRRLEALKHLKWKEVEIELVKLSDEDMAIQGLVENLQREGLTDIEKAEGIQRLMKQLDPTGKGDSSFERKRIQTLMGFGPSRLSELLTLTTFTKTAQTLVAQKKIAGRTAVTAHVLGGNEMIATAARHQLSQHAVVGIASELAAIPELKIRDQVRKAIVAGKVLDPEAVREEARKVTRQVAARSGKRPPPDLRIVIRSWTQTMIAWAKKLEEVEPYRDYIDADKDTADKFKVATRELIDKLKRFL